MRAPFLIAGILAAFPASAQFSPMVQGSSGGSSVYVGPGDIVSFTGWWGLRAYNTAFAAALGTAAQIHRVSDSATLQVHVLSNGNLDVATAATFCAATTCQTDKLYDQSGGGDTMSFSTSMGFILNCVNTSLPCIQITTTSQHLIGTNTITPASPLTMNVVGVRVSGSNTVEFIDITGSIFNNYINSNTNNTWRVVGGTGNISTTAADGTWHSASGVINGASSVLNVDGVETTGTVTVSTSAGPGQMLQTTGTSTNQLGEGGYINSTAINSTQRANLRLNQKAYWGTP